jgi:hypothetical protein
MFTSPGRLTCTHGALLFVLVMLISSSSSLGCGLTEAPPVQRVLAAFPEQASRLFEGEVAFTESGDAFEPLGPRGASVSRLSLSLPRRGEQAILMRARELTVSVREIDGEGEGSVVGPSVVYARSGRRSVWTKASGGFE